MTVNGAATRKTGGLALLLADAGALEGVEQGWNEPSRTGGSGPLSSMSGRRRRGRRPRPAGARRCGSSPRPGQARCAARWPRPGSGGRGSGRARRSARRKTTPRPAAAGRSVAVVAAPVWSPMPFRTAARSIVRGARSGLARRGGSPAPGRSGPARYSAACARRNSRGSGPGTRSQWPRRRGFR